MRYRILPSSIAKRAIVLGLVSSGVVGGTVGCRAILGIDDGSPLGPTDDGGLDPGDGTRDAGGDAFSAGDGRAPGAVERTEPQWPLPVSSPAPANYELTDDTVLDKTTGLMWQRRVANQGRVAWEDAVRTCPKLRLGGYDDWRLPTRIEMISIVDYGPEAEPINPGLFPDNNNYQYQWTASVYRAERRRDARWVATNGAAWYRDLSQSSDGLPFRCVRAGKVSGSTRRFIVEGATVKDARTGLSWEQALGAPQDIASARRRCEDLSPPGFRLPNLRELQTLIDEAETENPIWDDAFAAPAAGVAPTLWSDTFRGKPPSTTYLYVDFKDGATHNQNGESQRAGVRCVR
ncbi:DUF1566 domain-containing protein [Pendulispora albinea]|uniref:DUF1566 domain-containing protein n=1 Tax=Pendulispora albinea TaxID=2741071 RepID=A0ABZ2LRV8_9BACT